MPLLERNYLDKHDALNEAAALTMAGIGVKAATLLNAAADKIGGGAV